MPDPTPTPAPVHRVTLTRPDGASVTVESSGATLNEVRNTAQTLLNEIKVREQPK